MSSLYCWLLLACLLAPQRASAHDFPTAFQALFQPGNSERLVLALRPGLALTEDGGEHWDLSCGALMGLAGNDRYAAQLTSDGHLLIAAFSGLYRDDGTGCSWNALQHTGLPPGKLVGLNRQQDGSIRALTARSGADNGLFISRDHGLHWSAAGAPLMAAYSNQLLTADSDPNRLYVSGTRADGTAALWVSSDAGEHWSENPSPSALEVLAVDPTNADRVFVVRRAPPGLGLPDALCVSTDAGASFSVLLELMELGGLALSPDGRTLWVGSQAGGLYRAQYDEAFERIHDSLHVGCLHYTGELLWACGRDQSGGLDPFALASSADRGMTWRPRMRSDQVRRLRTCGNPQYASTCSNEWNQWKWDVFGSTSEPPPLSRDAGTGVDASRLEPVHPLEPPLGAAETGTSAQRAPSGCALASDRPCAWWWFVLAAARLSRRRSRSCSGPSRDLFGPEKG